MRKRVEKWVERALSIKRVLILLAAAMVVASTLVVTLLMVSESRKTATNNAFEIAGMALEQQQMILSNVLNEQKRTSSLVLASFIDRCEGLLDSQQCLSDQLAFFAKDRPAKRAILTVAGKSVGWGEEPAALLDYPPLGRKQVAYFNMASEEPSYIVEVASPEGDLLRLEYALKDVLEFFAEHVSDVIDETWLIAPGGEWIYPLDGSLATNPDFVTACLSGESGQSVVPIDNNPMLMVYWNIPEIGGGCLNVSLSEARALAGEGAFSRLFLGLVSMLVLVGGFLGSYTAKHVAAPLEQLTERAQGLMAGDVASPIRVRGPREVRLFARAFNQMADDISSKSQELQRKAGSLQRALESRDQFLSYASHELKTPLTVLKLRLEMITQARESSRLDIKMLERSMLSAEGEVERLIRLIAMLFDVNRAKLGKLTIEPLPCDLSEMIQGVVERFEGQLHFSEITLALDIPDSLPGMWDCFRLEQVLFNLMGNAIKFGQGKPLSISAVERTDSIVLKFQDAGIGIAAEDQKHIFDVYEQADVGQEQGGLGLGLFISAEIIRAHGGTLEVKSLLGEGATFIVTLPKAHKSEYPSAQEPKHGHPVDAEYPTVPSHGQSSRASSES